jgi:uncharacterized protein YggT (Ycf19 family)
MINVAPARALNRRTRHALQLSLFAVAGGILAIIVGLAMKGIPLVPPSDTWYGAYVLLTDVLILGGGLTIIVGAVIAIRAATWRTENDLAKVVGNVLSNHLDERYTFIRNVSKLSIGYVDAVLIGVQGVLVFRILDRTGVFLDDGDRWLRFNQRDNRWIPAGMDPSREAIADMKSLQKFFGEHGLPQDTPIFGVVVFMKEPPLVQITMRNATIPAVTLSTLYSGLQSNYFAQERISRGAADSIVKLLRY